jgi:hypothetical protein
MPVMNIMLFSITISALAGKIYDEKAELAGSLFCGGISDPGEASGKNEEQVEAYEFGKALE